MSFTLFLLLGPLLLEPVHARLKHHAHSRHSLREPTTAGIVKPATDARDPADIALDKKIKSICRGC